MEVPHGMPLPKTKVTATISQMKTNQQRNLPIRMQTCSDTGWCIVFTHIEIKEEFSKPGAFENALLLPKTLKF